MANYTNTGAYLRALYDALRNNLEEELNARGYTDISPSHGWIFHHTAEEGSRITELAAIAKITKQSMSALAAQLEAGGYVKKKPDPADQRASLLVLTPKGKKVRDAGREINYQFERTWEQKLGRKDYVLFRQMLMRLCEE